MGVKYLRWMQEKICGICPSSAPAKNNRAEVKRVPFTPPKVDNATKIGMIHSTWSFLKV
jgi:hypothetical protein